jgi:glycogen(starch) synthase
LTVGPAVIAFAGTKTAIVARRSLNPEDRQLVSRVALVPSAYLPSLGGVEELSRHLALALRAAGHEVEVWTQQADGIGKPDVEVMDGIRVRRFPFPLPRTDPRTLAPTAVSALRSMRAVRAAAKSFRPDVLHVQCFGPNGVYATALSRLAGIPLVISLQGETIMDDHDAFDVSTSLRVGLRLGLKQAKRVTGCSQFTLDDAIARFGLRPEAGTVIFNGVALADKPPASAPSRVEGRYVLALGRVVVKKGFDLLIRAFDSISSRHPDVTLAIGGSGHEEEALHRLVADLRLADRVRFLGRLTRTEVASTMAAAEVFVMPSRLEPFGIVLLEAWRAGRATIATSRGGPPEFVEDGETGLLADPFDTPALAAALDAALRDPARRRALGEAGRRRAADFDWPTIAALYQQVYAEIIADAGGSIPHPSRP